MEGVHVAAHVHYGLMFKSLLIQFTALFNIQLSTSFYLTPNNPFIDIFCHVISYIGYHTK